MQGGKVYIESAEVQKEEHLTKLSNPKQVVLV